MPISRMQMPRQLRRGGGIMDVAPRQGYFLGGIGDAIKGIGKGIKSAAKGIVSTIKDNPALALAAFNFAPMLAGKAPFIGMGSLAGSAATIPGLSLKGLAGEKTLGKTLGVMAGGTVLGGVLGALSPEEQEEISSGRNIEALRGKLTTAYQNLGYDESEIPALVDNDLSEYTSGAGGYAEGGRIGYNDGTDLKKDFLIKKGYRDMVENMSVREIDELFNSVKGTTTAANTYREPANMGGRMGYASGSEDKFMELVERLREQGFSQQEAIEEAREKLSKNMAYGGRMNYAMGTDQIVNQASGIMGLPQRTNKAGVKELDLRESGGFIPPVGIKEKADDIPAMLSNNEFVFTADAVRGMGDGNVNKGAQRMYDMMKKLEKGGRV